MTATIFIGDVHGCLDQLEEVVSVARALTTDLVFLGDYVNRGKQSAQVIDALIRLEQDPHIQTRFLRGNHDKAMLDTLEGSPADEFLRMGGATTIRSYVQSPFDNVEDRFRRTVPEAHRKFLSNLQETIENEEFVASHMSIERPSQDRRFYIAGHHAQITTAPLIGPSSALIDTGCGTLKGGRLTAFSWPSRDWFQSGVWL